MMTSIWSIYSCAITIREMGFLAIYLHKILCWEYDKSYTRRNIPDMYSSVICIQTTLLILINVIPSIFGAVVEMVILIFQMTMTIMITATITSGILIAKVYHNAHGLLIPQCTNMQSCEWSKLAINYPYPEPAVIQWQSSVSGTLTPVFTEMPLEK